MNSIKIAKTEYPILALIQNRWSARAFADKAVTDTEVETLLEAASWAASANNEQPWEYVYALAGTEGFHKLWDSLMPGNQPWAKSAAVLIVAIARTTMAGNGNPNPWAEHDLGMANANLFLQATEMGLYGHAMAGFYKDKVIDALELSKDRSAICVIALGYLGDPESLEEPFKTRELTARTRKPIASFSRKLS